MCQKLHPLYLSNFMMKIFRGPTKKTVRGYTVYKTLAEVGDGGEKVQSTQDSRFVDQLS